jgi:hypothetical protein
MAGVFGMGKIPGSSEKEKGGPGDDEHFRRQHRRRDLHFVNIRAVTSSPGLDDRFHETAHMQHSL